MHADSDVFSLNSMPGKTDSTVYLLDHAGNILNWNVSDRLIKDCMDKELAGCHVSLFYSMPECNMNIPAFHLVVASDLGHFTREECRIRRNGSSFRAVVLLECLYNDDGRVAGFVKMDRDITAIDLARTALIDTLQLSDHTSGKADRTARFFENIIGFKPQFILLIDEATRTVIMSSRCPGLLAGMITAPISGETLDSILPPSLEKHFTDMIESRRNKKVTVRGCHTVYLNGKKLRLSTSVISLSGVSSEPRILLSIEVVTPSHDAAESLRYLAYHDTLTGLPNRLAFIAVLDDALSGSLPLAIAIIDMHRFRGVNVMRGHAAGDTLLRDVAGRFKGILGHSALLARADGDKFLLLITSAYRQSHVGNIAQSLIDSLQIPFLLDKNQSEASVSIGIALSGQMSTAEELIASADIALYEAKARGGSCSAFYTPALAEATIRKNAIKRGLLEAMNSSAGDLCLHYQPIVDTFSGKIMVREALLRWVDPVLGNGSPTEFISVAE